MGMQQKALTPFLPESTSENSSVMRGGAPECYISYAWILLGPFLCTHIAGICNCPEFKEAMAVSSPKDAILPSFSLSSGYCILSISFSAIFPEPFREW